ncbi:MAG TPA: hypothetical protein VL137_01015 [Polyangiaceae bacterium]|nr:hypothetical protein [Polyangiaceae bacterium]
MEHDPLRHGALPELRGELSTTKFGRLRTALLALCGALFLMRALRLFARLFLARRVSAVVTLDQSGLHLNHRTAVLGKVRREGEIVIPLHNLSRIERSVRYQGFGFYAGALALSSGTFLGATLMIDAARTNPSAFELVLWGALVFGLGFFLDFLLVTLLDDARGKCRLQVVTKDGLQFTVSSLDPPLVDGLLKALTVELERTAPVQLA